MPDAIKLQAVLQNAIQHLAAAGVENPEVDAELLVAFVFGISRGQVQAKAIAGDSMDETKSEQLNNFFARRINREPLQHITGVAYFRNLELEVGPGVFVPRPETEFVAGLAIDALRAVSAESPIAVDLGTGSGAIALALATEVPHARVFAVEKSDEAITFTKKNFARYSNFDVELLHGDLASAFEELNGKVSVVVSNPPYIPTDAVPRDPEVKNFDPELALYGGADGLDVMHQVSATAKRLLVSGGALVVEHADSQAESVCQLLLAEGWRLVRSHQDLTARNRAVTAIK